MQTAASVGRLTNWSSRRRYHLYLLILAAIGLDFDSQAKAGDRFSSKILGLTTAKIVEAIKMKVSLDCIIKRYIEL